MAFFVYILKSINFERYYIGSTQNLLKRLDRHNQGRSKATEPYRLWRNRLYRNLCNPIRAIKRERQIKNRKRTELIKK